MWTSFKKISFYFLKKMLKESARKFFTKNYCKYN